MKSNCPWFSMLKKQCILSKMMYSGRVWVLLMLLWFKYLNKKPPYSSLMHGKMSAFWWWHNILHQKKHSPPPQEVLLVALLLMRWLGSDANNTIPADTCQNLTRLNSASLFRKHQKQHTDKIYFKETVVEEEIKVAMKWEDSGRGSHRNGTGSLNRVSVWLCIETCIFRDRSGLHYA